MPLSLLSICAGMIRIFLYIPLVLRGSTNRRMPTHTTTYQRIPAYTNACHPMQLYFGYLYVIISSNIIIKLTAKFYIDTISQTTKIPSFYVLNRIAKGTVSAGGRPESD